MKDVNKPLREAYFTALQATNEAVYYMQAPDELRGNRIVFMPQNGLPVLMKTGSTVNVTMQVVITTEGQQYNSGDSADTIAGKVYQVIYPETTFVLDMGADFQMVSTELQNDTVQQWTLKNQIIAIDRTITFTHRIYIR